MRQAGLSEVSAQTAKRAQAVTPICDVQLEYGLSQRGLEKKVLPGLRELGVGVTAYGVLGRGLLSRSKAVEKTDFRSLSAALHRREPGGKQRRLVDALGRGRSRARRHAGADGDRLGADAREGHCADPGGAHSEARLEESLGALELALSPDQIARLEAAVPADKVAGTRYDKVAMTHLDSER